VGFAASTGALAGGVAAILVGNFSGCRHPDDTNGETVKSIARTSVIRLIVNASSPKKEPATFSKKLDQTLGIISRNHENVAGSFHRRFWLSASESKTRQATIAK
jgi:hypothetical protein